MEPEHQASPARNDDAHYVGPYRLIEELGRGGQAIVYLAEDPRLSRRVALKVLHGVGPASEDVLQRFRREAQVASRLDHAGICPVYDTGMADGVAYIVMKYVEGKVLGRLLSTQRRTPETDTSFFTEIRLRRNPRRTGQERSE